MKKFWQILVKLVFCFVNCCKNEIRANLNKKDYQWAIILGFHKTADEYRRALAAAGFKISCCTNQILNKTPIAAAETPIYLVQKTVAELGLPNGGTLKQIYINAIALGYPLCPAEVGPALRLNYQNQPKGEWLRIAMEPITDSAGDLHIFSVEHLDDDYWFDAFYGYPTGFYSAGDVFVLQRHLEPLNP